ncbi:hypothetical protein YYE_04954 [Plasmodium vinckei vinckei]|uniref:CIR protein PIR protein n=1 Tax=Plasmodium vinckei vinckei TaxID=54757 RepID=A0A081I940_PLAVN|nr:hypothetical protein YYE_04954 [Plasmodium vinckei vinckei]
MLSTLKKSYDNFRKENTFDSESQLPEFNEDEIESCEDLREKKARIAVLLLPQSQPQNIKIESPGSQHQEDRQSSELEDPSIKRRRLKRRKKTEASKNMPLSNGNGLEPTSSLPEDTNHKKQFLSPVDSRKKTPSLNIGIGNTRTNVEDKTSQLVNSIDISKGYKQPEIVITVLLIPIILLIMYKYLPYGWRKELKRKKNMKKAINSIGGKIPMQIIINSSSHKK